MLKKLVLIGCLSWMLVGFSLAALAQVIERSGTSADETIDCQGRSFKLSGTSNHYVLLGDCPDLSIEGVDNMVQVERVGHIRISGTDNKVLWSESLAGRIPENTTEGVDNTIAQERRAPPPEPKHAQHRARHRDHDNDRMADGDEDRDAPEGDREEAGVQVDAGPHGGSVSVQGHQGSVQASGGPRGGSVSVEGSQGAVQVQGGPEGGSVRVETRQGSIQVGGGAQGGAARVKAGRPGRTSPEAQAEAAPEAAQALNISGVSLSRTVTCHGENVSVSGNQNRIRLNGTCGTVSVSGNDQEVQIECARAIDVVGNDNKVTWERNAGGNAPRISKNGRGNQVLQAGNRKK